MSRSNVEEIIGTLWLIAAILAFANGYRVWGYLFAIKAAFDQGCSIYFAIIKHIKDRDDG